eukprot:Gb_00726 [translate_table: standard]
MSRLCIIILLLSIKVAFTPDIFYIDFLFLPVDCLFPSTEMSSLISFDSSGIPMPCDAGSSWSSNAPKSVAEVSSTKFPGFIVRSCPKLFSIA